MWARDEENRKDSSNIFFFFFSFRDKLNDCFYIYMLTNLLEKYFFFFLGERGKKIPYEVIGPLKSLVTILYLPIPLFEWISFKSNSS